MSVSASHLGRARMESATWQMPRLPRPHLSPAARRAVRGRLALVGVALALFSALSIFGRPGVPDYPDAAVRWTATDATTGEPVSRSEWIDRALAL